MITIRVDGKPVAKGRPRIGMSGGGRPMAFTPAHTRKYEAQLRLAAQYAMDGMDPLQGPVAVKITADIPVPKSYSKKKKAKCLSGEVHPTKRPDLDNYAKIAFDACNEIVFVDDNQITTFRCDKRYSTKPGLTIEIMPFNAEAA